jgi:hypothetical protein
VKRSALPRQSLDPLVAQLRRTVSFVAPFFISTSHSVASFQALLHSEVRIGLIRDNNGEPPSCTSSPLADRAEHQGLAVCRSRDFTVVSLQRLYSPATVLR